MSEGRVGEGALLDFLLEIGTEEIPARMLPGAMIELERLVLDAMGTNGLRPLRSKRYGTPRRLALLCEGVPPRQQDREEIVAGPPVQAAFDPEGRPTRAAIGFAKAQGVETSDLERVAGPKGEVVAVRRRLVGRAACDVLSEAIPDLLGRLTFPKTMRWGSGQGPFVRPIHWIVAMLGAEVVAFEFCGVRSGRVTMGHRFMDPDPIDLPAASTYEAALRQHYVIASPDERKDAILKAMVAEETEHGCMFLKDEALLEEVANLVEYPVFATGVFDGAFLKLPREVLVTAMQSHQRYFPVVARSGELVNRFGVVSNTRARDMAVVVRGNERVLAARLYDARFFYETDRKTGIRAMRERLSERLFLKDAGSMRDKTERIVKLALRISEAASLDNQTKNVVADAAELCKSDLMSAMVGEFPELQGIMGSYYAREEGEPETPVAKAIREHYLPRFSGDVLPESVEGAVIGLADRLDSIVSCFSVGAIPTGSKDPLGLRRAAIGAFRIMMGRPELQRLTLPPLLGDAAEDVRLVDFFTERFHGILTEDFGIPTDFANAVEGLLMAGPLPPSELVARARVLCDFAAETAGFRDFLDSVFKRVGNILRQSDEKFPKWRSLVPECLEVTKDYRDVLEHPLERALEEARIAAMDTYLAARESGAYHDFLVALYSLKEPLARFFGSGRDGVPVLIEQDEDKRLARIALLHRVFAQFSWYADFSRITTR